MNNKLLYLPLVFCALILSSCATTSYYSSTTCSDGIYYRPTKASREAIVANNQEETYQRNRPIDSYFEVDTVTGRVYLAEGVSYSDLLRKFDSPNYRFTFNVGGWCYDPWYNPWWGSWRFSWCDPWWGPMPYSPWYRPWSPWGPYGPYGPVIVYDNRNVVYGKRGADGSISGGLSYYNSGSTHRQYDYYSSASSTSTGSTTKLSTSRGATTYTSKYSTGGGSRSAYSSDYGTGSSNYRSSSSEGGSRSRSSYNSGSSYNSSRSSYSSGGSRSSSSYGGGSRSSYSGGGYSGGGSRSSYGGGGGYSGGGGSRSSGGGRR